MLGIRTRRENLNYPSDVELLEDLLKRWAQTRHEVEEMLCAHFGMGSIEQIWEHRCPPFQIGPWHIYFHGGGICVSQPGNKAGIDYDFDQTLPDEFKCRDFLIKQYNAGLLTKKWWRPLMQDSERFSKAYRDNNLIKSNN